MFRFVHIKIFYKYSLLSKIRGERRVEGVTDIR